MDTTFLQNCIFSNPIDLGTGDFEYSEMNCTGSTTAPTSTIAVGYNPTTTISSSTAIQVYGSFSAGEIMITVLLFALFLIELIKMLARALDRVKTKKTFLGYTNAEVEVKDVL